MNIEPTQPGDSASEANEDEGTDESSSADADGGGGTGEAQSSSPSTPDSQEFPPSIQRWKWGIICVAWIVVLIFGVCTFWQFFDSEPSSPAINLIYVSIALVLPAVYVTLQLILPVLIHWDRLVDYSIVNGVIVEAQTVEPRLPQPHERPVDLSGKLDNLLQEVKRVQQLGARSWTEYQILSLNQMLVDFLKPDDLIARAQSSLADLEDYAEDDAYGGYDRKHYGQWEERIKNAITKIQKVDDNAENDENANGEQDSVKYNLMRDEAAEELRAAVRTLLEHVEDYRKDWSEGSTILRALVFFCVVAIPVFLAMGLLPTVHPDADGTLSMLHWGFLGIAGSITAVLRALRQTNTVEVGNTDGKRELWRTIQSGALGLVAGVLSYALVAGELFGGNALPDLASNTLKDVSLSVLWAFAAGFYFESVFERVRTSTVGAA